MKLLLGSLIACLLCLTAAGAEAGMKAGSDSCVPSFREVTRTPMVVNAGWTLQFSVALIGCKNQLESITDDELHRIQAEFEKPTRWSALLTVAQPQGDVLRKKATARINELLGRKVVTDVLVTDTGLRDTR